MIRKEFQLPDSVLENAKSFFLKKTDEFDEVRLLKKYDNIAINICLEKNITKQKVITFYVGVMIGSSYPATFTFELNHIFDLLKVYRLILKDNVILLRVTPQGGTLKETDYISYRSFLYSGMEVNDLNNFATYISFNDKVDLFYLTYNLLLNNGFIIFEPKNDKTDLNLRNLLIEKFEYYGYDNEFLLNNEYLKTKNSFKNSQIVLDTLIVYVLDILLNNDKSGFSLYSLRKFYNAFYTLNAKEIEFNYEK